MKLGSQNVTDQPNESAIFQVWNFHEHADAAPAFRRACALVINLNNSARDRFPHAKASIVLGIGANAWRRLGLPQPAPKELAAFEPIRGATHTAVATPGDLHIHIRTDHRSYAHDMATVISDALRGVADCSVEVHGFRYWDSRSILGFVDGTENPQGDSRAFFAKVGDEDPAYAGGSYLFVQKYLHDLVAWRALPVGEQEKVIGRSKHDDIEMADDVKPANSHSALANVGDDLKIVRDNMPFGTVSSNAMGTYFICYASTFTTVEKMLRRMFIGDPPGRHDRILDFSTAHTGTLFFVPSMDMLTAFKG